MFSQSSVPSSLMRCHLPLTGGGGTSTPAAFSFLLPEGFLVRFARPLLLGSFAIACLLTFCCSVRTAGERVKCQDLVNDPQKYHGRRVLLDTAGCQPGDAPETIVWRKRASQPPVVLVHFQAPYGTLIPPKVDGIVESVGLPVVVSGARGVW